MNKIKKTEKGLGWLERIMQLVEKHSIFQFIKAFFIILITALIIGFISNPGWLFEQYKKWEDDNHKIEMAISEKNNVLLQAEVEALLWKTNADRVILLSYHNTKKSLAGAPYIYLTAVNEYFRDGVAPVAEGYSAVKTSLYPMINYISSKGFFCGDIEDLRTIDKALAYRMEGNDAKHLAMLQIEGDVPLGVLVVTYTDVPNHNCSEVETLMRKSALKIGILMENKK